MSWITQRKPSALRRPRARLEKAMERLTHKTSMVIVSTGDGTEVYRSVGDLPAGLRKKLVKATTGVNAATILIADENGRKEIVRSLQGGDSPIAARLLEGGGPGRRTGEERWTWRHLAEVGLVVGIGVCLWALSRWK